MAATEMMQHGNELWQAVDWLRMTTEQLEKGYGYCHPDFERSNWSVGWSATALNFFGNSRIGKKRCVIALNSCTGDVLLFVSRPIAHDVALLNQEHANYLKILVGVAGFEPATPASRTQCSTGLSHTPTRRRLIALGLADRNTPVRRLPTASDGKKSRKRSTKLLWPCAEFAILDPDGWMWR
jgi:hypothetical protein